MKISVGNSRTDKHWNLKEISIDEFSNVLSQTKRTAETVEQFKKMTKAQQDNIKDVGGFVAGELKDGVRKKNTVICRSALTLDADYAILDLADIIEMFYNFRCIIYSTHKHSAEKPRLRLVIPLSRDVTADEYVAVSRKIADDIGMEFFDDTTYEPSRLMYWPSTSADGDFYFKDIEGEPLNPDIILAKYKDWRNISELPVSQRQQALVQREVKKQADPVEKKGVIGAFCKAYTISEAIDKFIPETYKPSVMQGRYDYVPADSSAGVVLYEEKFAYSHHATDPACGKLMNAFDIVRLHKFGELDTNATDNIDTTKLPSFKAMQEFAVSDNRTKKQLTEERMAQAQEEFEVQDWTELLEYNKQGVLINNVRNAVLVLENDDNFKNFGYNEMANKVEVTGDVPWNRPSGNAFWRDADTAQLKALLDNKYTAFSTRNHDVAFTKVTDDRSFHPIRKYLDNLKKWDGVSRISTLLVDYFGADNTPYTQAVSRKSLVAAVARIYKPGTKFDSVLILNGSQGIGKSTFFAKLAKSWFSDSLTLTDMRDKTGAEKIQGYWILELGELAGMKKADIESVKSFISRTDDEYRPSYGRTVESHPRQCIIVGSTNAESGFLRDITGNRRFWPVKVNSNSKKKSWNLTDEEIDQIWAEAVHFFEKGEKLYLEGDELVLAVEEQSSSMETDEREGLVQRYLDVLLPNNWADMDLYERRNHLNSDGITRPTGDVERKTVSNMEIWCECFGKDPAAMKRADSYEISTIMQKIGGWKKAEQLKRIPIYGKQRIYQKEKE